VLVAGATGGVGQIVVAKLIERGFTVRALTRSLEKAERLFGSSNAVEAVEVDLRDAGRLEKAAVYVGCAGAILALGTTAFPSSRYACTATAIGTSSRGCPPRPCLAGPTHQGTQEYGHGLVLPRAVYACPMAQPQERCTLLRAMPTFSTNL
jgi:hypothetical protein